MGYWFNVKIDIYFEADSLEDAIDKINWASKAGLNKAGFAEGGTKIKFEYSCFHEKQHLQIKIRDEGLWSYDRNILEWFYKACITIGGAGTLEYKYDWCDSKFKASFPVNKQDGYYYLVKEDEWILKTSKQCSL